MKINYDVCRICGAPIKEQNNSLHVWEIKYECGYHVLGAIDTKTHGKGHEIIQRCSTEIEKEEE